jgi:energy-converting hydrogenase Eha subunit E
MKLNDILQWTGAVFIIAGHICNAIGPSVYPYNIVAFTLGTIAFMSWTIRVKNRPQLIVNIVAIVTCLIGLVNAWRL